MGLPCLRALTNRPTVRAAINILASRPLIADVRTNLCLNHIRVRPASADILVAASPPRVLMLINSAICLTLLMPARAVTSTGVFVVTTEPAAPEPLSIFILVSVLCFRARKFIFTFAVRLEDNFVLGPVVVDVDDCRAVTSNRLLFYCLELCIVEEKIVVVPLRSIDSANVRRGAGPHVVDNLAAHEGVAVSLVVALFPVGLLDPIDDSVGGLTRIPPRNKLHVISQLVTKVEALPVFRFPADEGIASTRGGFRFNGGCPASHKLRLDVGATFSVEGNPMAVYYLRVQIDVGILESHRLDGIAPEAFTGIPSSQTLINGQALFENLSGFFNGNGIPRHTLYSVEDAILVVIEEDVVHLFEMRIEVNRLGLVDILLAKAVKEFPALLFGVPAGELEAVVVCLRRCGLVKGVVRLHDLSADNLIVNVEVVRREGRLALISHHIDAEVVDVEALDGGVRLAGANCLHGGGIICNSIHVDRAVAYVAVEEADVDRTIRLDYVAVGAKQGHIDGYGVLHDLAVLLDNVGDGVDDILAVHLVSADGRALRKHALAGGHLDDDVANVGVALVGGAAHVSNNGLFLGRRDGGVVRDIPSRGPVGAGAVLGSIGPRLAAFGGLGFLSIGCNGDGAGHLFGGDGVLARLVGLKCGNHAVDGGFDGLHLVALRCAHRELQLFIRGSLHGLVARAVGGAVIGKRRFRGKIQLNVYLLVRRSRLCAGGIRLGARSRCGAGGVAFGLVARIAGLVAFRRIRGFRFGRGRFRRLVCGNVFDLGRDLLFGSLFGLLERRECGRAHHLGGQQRRKEDSHGLHAVLPPTSEDSAALHSHHSPSACDCSLAPTFGRAGRRCLPLRLRGLWRQPRQAGAWRFPASIP